MRQEAKNASSAGAVAFDAACVSLEALLVGNARPQIVAALSAPGNFGQALFHLRDRMRAHVWQAGPRQIRLHRVVDVYDRRARETGFHLLHDWDGKADRVNEDIIPVDVLNYIAEKRGGDDVDATALAILVDYYFLYVLTLLSLAVWDAGDADANLDRLDALVRELQGPNGSGQKFVDDAATLYLLAGSHYELADHGYDALLQRVRALGPTHRLNVAFCHAAGLGSHLRFGFEATYGKSVAAMRDDNVVDYPWLLFSLSTLMTEYARMERAGVRGPERARVVEALVNGLSPDAEAFVGDARLPALSAHEAERAELEALFARHQSSLVTELEQLRPRDGTYSPLAFFFNFSQNVIKGAVVDALLWGSPWTISLNDLLTGLPAGDPLNASKEKLARILMAYARSSPDRIRGRLTPAIVYDPATGRRWVGDGSVFHRNAPFGDRPR
jgi:hypothetical protein